MYCINELNLIALIIMYFAYNLNLQFKKIDKLDGIKIDVTEVYYSAVIQ